MLNPKHNAKHVWRTGTSDGLDTDGAGEPAKISESSIYLWNESQNEFGAKVTAAKFGNSQRSLLSPTGGVKSIPPTTEKLATETIHIQQEERHEH